MARPLRLLFLTYEIPAPLNNGDRIYTANLLRRLKIGGHHLSLVAFRREDGCVGRDRDDRDHARQRLDELASRVTLVNFRAKTHVRAFFSLLPGMLANRFSRDLIHTALRVLDQEGPFDAVIVNHFKMAFVAEALRARVPAVPTVLITHNAEALLSMSVYRNHTQPLKKVPYLLDWLKTMYHEPRYLKMYDVVTAICERDHLVFTRAYGLPTVRLVPPGIDSAAYPADLPVPSRDKGAIVCGTFLWEPKRLNLLTLLGAKSFPLLKQNGIDLYVVGQADPAFVKAVNRKHPGVIMTGRVSDVREYYRRCSVALLPEVMGGGFKLKLLEAAALKRAVVALKNAVTSPGFVAGTHYAEAEDMDQLIVKTVSLMDRPQAIRRMCIDAYELVSSKYGWEQAGDCLSDAIQMATRGA